jgi:hypothetical protein
MDSCNSTQGWRAPLSYAHKEKKGVRLRYIISTCSVTLHSTPRKTYFNSKTIFFSIGKDGTTVGGGTVRGHMRQTAEAVELRHERTRSLENGSIGRGHLHGIDDDFSLMLVVLVDQI